MVVTDPVYIPPPKPRAVYDPADPNREPPKWSWYRARWNLPVDKGPKEWTRIGDVPESDDDPDWRGVVRSKIERWPDPVESKLGQPEDPRYFYFDTPDYADPFKKLGYAFRFFLYTGILAGSMRGHFRDLPFNVPTLFTLFRTRTIPWLGAGMAASTSAIVSANLRGNVDDYYNYALAGLVFGSILGHKNHRKWLRHVFVCVPTAVVLKHNAEVNGFLIQKVNVRAFSFGISGFGAENGISDGDVRFGLRSGHGDPGRDVRLPIA